MRNHFDFKLKGMTLFPIWVLYFFLYILPYTLINIVFRNQDTSKPSMMNSFLSLCLIIPQYIIDFFIRKLQLSHIVYKDVQTEFRGHIGDFLKVFFKGLLLTIITFGIYTPWFVTNILSFYANNTYYKDDNFKFNGSPVTLLIYFVMMFISVMSLMMVIVFTVGTGNPNSSLYIVPVMLVCILIFTGLVFDWMIDFSYKDYRFKIQQKTLSIVGKVALELFLSIITVGIYSPIGMLKIYKYIIENFSPESEYKKIRFGYTLNASDDFIFLWGQIVACVITLSFYCPWAICNIFKRVANNTYTEEELKELPTELTTEQV